MNMQAICDVLRAASAWALEGLLVFNLAAYALLRVRASQAVALVSMAVNIALISAVLDSSGGGQSLFWPLYLVPIYTACLYLERRHVLLAAAASGTFLTYFYLDALWFGTPWNASELMIKLLMLVVASVVTMRLAFRERQERLALRLIREKIEKLSVALRSRAAAEREAAKSEGLSAAVTRTARGLSELHNVILGSADLLQRELVTGPNADLDRIRSAAWSCSQLACDLALHAQGEEPAPLRV